jgi:hypothetical protein
MNFSVFAREVQKGVCKDKGKGKIKMSLCLTKYHIMMYPVLN